MSPHVVRFCPLTIRQISNTVMTDAKLFRFLSDALPDLLKSTQNKYLTKIKTKDDFIKDAISALKLAPMAIRLTPHILSRIDWKSPLDDPIRRQFVPLKSGMIPDHEHLTLDSLNEEADSRTSAHEFCVGSVANIVQLYLDWSIDTPAELCSWVRTWITCPPFAPPFPDKSNKMQPPPSVRCTAASVQGRTRWVGIPTPSQKDLRSQVASDGKSSSTTLRRPQV